MKQLMPVLIVSLTLTACGGVQIKPIDASSARVFTKPTQEEAERRIRDHLEKILIDPESLRMKCSPVRKGWGRSNRFEPPQFGWVTICDVNSKNRFGGYVGAKPHGFIINGPSFVAIDNPFFPGSSEGTYMGVIE